MAILISHTALNSIQFTVIFNQPEAPKATQHIAHPLTLGTCFTCTDKEALGLEATHKTLS